MYPILDALIGYVLLIVVSADCQQFEHDVIGVDLELLSVDQARRELEILFKMHVHDMSILSEKSGPFLREAAQAASCFS